jgi:chromosome partitioning protein
LVIVDSEGTSNFKTAYAAMDSDFVVIPTRSSRLDLERTVETSDMLGKMCRGVPYRVLITQTGQVARSKAEWEIDSQIAQALPTFAQQMHALDAFRAMSNFRMTLSEVEANNLAKTGKARLIAQSVLADILDEIQAKESADV